MARIPRTTTVGSLKTYRYNLNRSSYTMGKAMEKVDTQRNFNSFAEDPAAATRCFQLRRAYLRTSAQYTVNDAVYRKYQQAWDCLDSVNDDLDTYTEGSSSLTDIVISLNDPDASGRNALGQDLVAKADSIIQTMNSRFGENFIFAGADTLNVPFTWTEKRNPDYIDTATADPADPANSAAYKYYAFADPANPDPNNVIGTNDISDLSKVLQTPKTNPAYTPDIPQGGDGYHAQYLDKDGNETDDPLDAEWAPVENKNYNEMSQYKYLKADGTGTNNATEAARSLCYRGVMVDVNDSEKMQYYLREENKYVDIGLGFQERDGEAVPSSVFDMSLQGAYYLGDTGTAPETVTYNDKEYTFDDIPNNIVSVMEELGQLLMRCNAENGAFPEPSEENGARALALARRFEDMSKIVKQRYTALDTESGFLKDNGELLTKNADTLSEQFLGMEDVNPAGAISDFMYAKYVYDTALKVGNSILSQSLMDYLNL